MTKLATWLTGAVLAVGFASAAWAEIYHWIGSDGLPHYGDRPPPGANAVRIQPAQGDFVPPPPAAAAAVDDAVDDNAADGENTGATDPERTARIRREQCAKARERLENYSGAARMQVRNEDGEVREMSAEERVQAIAHAESDVAQLCGQDE